MIQRVAKVQVAKRGKRVCNKCIPKVKNAEAEIDDISDEQRYQSGRKCMGG